MPRKDSPLIAVDVLRFACAVMVVFYHYWTTSWIEPTANAAILLEAAPAPAAFLIDLFRSNWIGVQLFFVISGMVIARSAENALPLIFLEKRLLRLVPAVLLCATATALTLTLAGRGGPGLLTCWLRSIAFWPVGQQIDPSYWTLCVELAFYLLTALFIATHRSAGAAKVATILLFGSGAFWTILVVNDAISHPIGVGELLNLTLMPHGCFFALGITLTSVAKDGLGPAKATKIGAALVICCVQILWKTHERASIGTAPVDLVTPLACFAVGVAILAATWRLQPLLARWIRPDFARRIGLMTYPLYLLHQEAGRALIGVLSTLGVSTEHAIGVAILSALAAAWLIASVLEPRTRHALVHLRSRMPSIAREPLIDRVQHRS